MHSTRCAKERKPQVSDETTTTTTTNTTTTPATGRAGKDKCRSALLVIGTYHSVMAGLVYRRSKFGMLFSIKHHDGCINSVAVDGKYMASSGTDERIFLFTNKSHKSLTAAERARLRAAGESLGVRLADLGHVSPPSEARCLVFVASGQFLLCGCGDGRLVVYRTRDWSVSLALEVHERGVVGAAVHPKSDGALAVTIGADRHVAVLDLVKGRLLSKWRYNTSLTANNNNNNNGDDDWKGEEERRSVKRPKLERRDGPHTVKFSPSGNYFTILSSHAFVVYETANMCVVARYQATSPQPRDEFHVFAFVDDDMMIFGNESGELWVCDGPWKSGGTEPRECTPVQAVAVYAPSESEQQVTDDKKEKRHPKQHTTRLKALHCVEGTVFSLDATGTVIAWLVGESLDGARTLAYVCSANCKGRVTAMDVLPL